MPLIGGRGEIAGLARGEVSATAARSARGGGGGGIAGCAAMSEAQEAEKEADSAAGRPFLAPAPAAVLLSNGRGGQEEGFWARTLLCMRGSEPRKWPCHACVNILSAGEISGGHWRSLLAHLWDGAPEEPCLYFP